MTPTDAQRVEKSKLLILDVLSGRVTHENRPDVYDDDLLLFAVRIVEVADPEWLREELAMEGYATGCRRDVACELTPEGRRSLCPIDLRPEP